MTMPSDALKDLIIKVPKKEFRVVSESLRRTQSVGSAEAVKTPNELKRERTLSKGDYGSDSNESLSNPRTSGVATKEKGDTEEQSSQKIGDFAKAVNMNLDLLRTNSDVTDLIQDPSPMAKISRMDKAGSVDIITEKRPNP